MARAAESPLPADARPASDEDIGAAPPRRLADLPGPPRRPLVGNLLQLDRERMHDTLERWAAAYGPLYRVDFGRGDALVVADAAPIATILRARPDGWRRLAWQQRVIREMGGHGVFSAEGDDWRRQRRLVMAAFDPAHLHRYFPSLVRVTERLKARLDDAAARGEALDLQSLLMRYTVDVTAGLAFGIDVDTQRRPDDRLQAHLDQVFPMLMRRIMAPIPWWRWVRLPSDRRFDAHLAQVHAAIDGFVTAARERIAREPERRERPENLLEAMIVAQDDDGERLSQEELVGNVMTVLLAGEDTTANTLCWTLHLLSRDRAAWDALVREVDDAVGGDPLVTRFETIRGLDGIERAVRESMRLRPVAPFLLLENVGPTTVADVELPPATTVACLMRPSGAPDVAGDATDDVHAFRPERWAGPPDRALTRASMPFGAGPRLCPGRYLAMVEMKMVLATIARNFDLVRVATDDGKPPRERMTFTMAPVGLRMTLGPRRSPV